MKSCRVGSFTLGMCLLRWLQNFLLPETSVKVVRDTMASLLTAPPPFGVAASLREAVRLLSACKAWQPAALLSHISL